MSDSEVDLEWLVKERSRIQLLSLRLLNILKAKKDWILASEANSDAALLMVGAAFSLWRAIFLTHINKAKRKNYADARDFLRKVVRHNTITYPDDVKFQTWSFGYYLNNCRFRLQAIRDLLNLEGAPWLDETLPIESDAQDEWTKHCDLLENALNVLESQLPHSA